jgi:hypothetical protein
VERAEGRLARRDDGQDRRAEEEQTVDQHLKTHNAE